MNEIEMTALLPLVTRLTELYTSKESSSVPYEIAQQLMEAVLYTIDEVTLTNSVSISTESTSTLEQQYQLFYQQGKELLLQKAKQAKEIYESLLPDFCDYNCKNYSDTVLSGMPAFFQKYDYRFCPQDHILTLDYPLLNAPDTKLCGVDLILFYLKATKLEQTFLSRFEPVLIESLLEQLHPEYQELYFDNICAPVLEHVLRCMILEHPIEQITFTENERQQLALYCNDTSLDQLELKMKQFLQKLFVGDSLDSGYFCSYARNAAVRLAHFNN